MPQLEIKDIGAPVTVETKDGQPRSYKPVTFAPTWTMDAFGRKVRSAGKSRVRNIWEDDNLYDDAQVGELVEGEFVTVRTTPHLVNQRIVTTHTFVVFKGEILENLVAKQDFRMVEMPAAATAAGAPTPAPVLLEDEE